VSAVARVAAAALVAALAAAAPGAAAAAPGLSAAAPGAAPAAPGAGLAAAAPGAAAQGGSSRCAGTHWVGAWGAAPSHAPLRIADQSVRQVVTPHIGGRSARVRLTNRFGTAPLTLDEVHLARTASGAAVVSASSRRVTFGGRGSVTIPPGADVVSDPVAIRFRASQDLTVSVYAGEGGPVSSHPTGSEDVLYVAPGNHAAEPGAEAFAAGPLRSWWIVNGVDVEAPASVGAVVTYGSSTTDGLLSVVGGPRGLRNTRWPDFLARRLARAGRALSVVNSGISGNRLRLDAAPGSEAFGPSGLSRLAPDVIAVPGVRTVVVLEGINDIAHPPRASAHALIAALSQTVRRLRFAGLRVVLGTILPAGPYGGRRANRTRLAVNAWIRGSRLPDAVADFDAALRDPAAPGRMLERYDSGDHLHPDADGYAAMAKAVDLSRLGGGCP
jgi:lysophospholipase L1-like esterase